MDDEPEHDVLDFDDNACFVDFKTNVATAYDTSTIPLDIKSLPDSLKYAFLSHDECLPIIIVSDLAQDQEEKLLDLLR